VTIAPRAVEQPAATPPSPPARPPMVAPEIVEPEIVRARFAGDTAVCPYCSETIKRDAKKCKHCGEILDPSLREVRQSSAGNAVTPVINISNVNTAISGGPRRKAWSPLVAMLLSFLIPGLGQLYKGQALNGFVWFVLVIAGYFLFIFPGVILHFCCICGAAMGDPYR